MPLIKNKGRASSSLALAAGTVVLSPTPPFRFGNPPMGEPESPASRGRELSRTPSPPRDVTPPRSALQARGSPDAFRPSLFNRLRRPNAAPGPHVPTPRSASPSPSTSSSRSPTPPPPILDRETSTSRHHSPISAQERPDTPWPPIEPGSPLSDQGSQIDRGLNAYAKHRGELLETLNSLHSTGIQNELDLPQIVVIGSQSVGKSSLIESMSGITLPRNTGTCTKCPMECHLQSSPTWSCKVVLRFQYDSRGSPLQEVHKYAFGPILFDKSNVEKTIRRAQKAILNPSTDRSYFLDDKCLEGTEDVPDELSFSPNCVCVKVSGPSVPDLYFYDLPGIIANVKDGESVEDIKAVEDIAKRYISRPNCLILLVITCETDFENQGAGRLVLRDPVLRKRTVGVLTKADRIEPGTSPKWLSTLRNEANQLQNGWFAVKQPSHRELESGISWEHARANEDEFFTQTEPWASLETKYRQKLGSINLGEHLSRILSELVSQQLPEIQSKVTSMLATVRSELVDLPVPTYTDPRREVLTLLRDLTKKISKHVEGLPSPIKVSARSPDSSLMHQVNGAYDRFRVATHRTAPRFRPWGANYSVGDNVTLVRMIKASEDGNDSQGQGIVLHAAEVMDLANRSRTRELPGNYPFSVKESIIKEFTKHWKKLATDCFREVEKIFTTHLDTLLKDHFKHHAQGGLIEDVGAVVREELRERVRLTTEKIDSLCRLEEQPFTQNDHYFFDYRAMLLNRYKTLLRESRGQSGLIDTLGAYDPSNNGSTPQTTWTNINKAISYLASVGIQTSASDLAKLLPVDAMEPALEIMAEVRAYFQVAYKRFSDVVPQQIDADFLRGFDGSVDIAVLSMELSKENCVRWMSESPRTVLKREELTGKMKRLELAKSKLEEHRFQT